MEHTQHPQALLAFSDAAGASPAGKTAAKAADLPDKTLTLRTATPLAPVASPNATNRDIPGGPHHALLARLSAAKPAVPSPAAIAASPRTATSPMAPNLPILAASPTAVRNGATALAPPTCPLPAVPPSPLAGPPATALGAATHIGQFELGRTIGTGSFGRVYFARLASTNEPVALKVLNKKLVVKLKQVEHIHHEQQILKSLQSPFCLQLRASFQDCQNLYLVMDYVCGGELFMYLRKNRRFPNNVARFYAAEVILALEYMHTKDIMYRDLKPENLLLDAHGHVKLCDYGFAKVVKDVTWTLCGTPDYLAPEIIQSKGYGKAVDWWALGVLIYEMVVGHPPFYHEDQIKSYQLILCGKYHVSSHLSPAAASLVRHLLHPDLTKRYGNLRNGVLDIQLHPWFAPSDEPYGAFDWALLVAQRLRPPIRPRLTSDTSTACYDAYPEIPTGEFGQPGADPFGDLFAGF